MTSLTGTYGLVADTLRTRHTKFLLFTFLVYLAFFAKGFVREAQAATTTCAVDLDTPDTIYYLTGNVAGNCTITANNVTIDGLDLYTITGGVFASGGPSGNGFDITVQNVTISSYIDAIGYSGGIGNAGNITVINSEIVGGIFVSGYDNAGIGGSGGNVTVTNSTVGGPIVAEGGDSSSIYGGAGGNVTITNSEVQGTIFSEGGDSSGAYAGNGGNVTIEDSSIVATINVNGGEGQGGGQGGIITVTDSTATNLSSNGGPGTAGNYAGSGSDVIITNSIVGNIESHGGLSESYGAPGGNITITDSETGTVSSLGSSSGMNAYQGGTIIITGSDTLDVTSNGGNINAAGGPGTGGNAGSINITDSNVDGGVTANGGYIEATFAGDGGNGGDISIEGSVVTLGVNSLGGSTRGTGHSSGEAGNITITDSEIGEDLATENTYGLISLGGSAVSAVSGHGGDAGNLTITGSTIHRQIRSGGGGGRSGGFTSGDGGTITIERSTIGVTDYGGNFISVSNGGGFGFATAASGQGGNLIVVDSNLDGYAYGGETLSLIDNAPTITAPDISIDFDDVFNPLTGVTATDIKDGNLTGSITASGTLSLAAGIYEIEYEVTDAGTTFDFNSVATSSGPTTVTASRTITRLAEQQTSSGGGGTSLKRRVSSLNQEGDTGTAEAIIAANPQFFTNTELSTLKTQLATLLELFKQLTGKSFNPTTIPLRDLDLDMEGPDVTKLQTFLIKQGFNITAGATGYFGPQTQSALIQYQTKHNITPAEGYFGAKTRAQIESLGGRWW